MGKALDYFWRRLIQCKGYHYFDVSSRYCKYCGFERDNIEDWGYIKNAAPLKESK